MVLWVNASTFVALAWEVVGLNLGAINYIFIKYEHPLNVCLVICGTMRHVLDQEVGGFNPGKPVSFLPGRRLDLACLFF